MCGIAGFLNFPQYGAEVCRKMTDSLAHRGPDDSGIEAFSVGNLPAGSVTGDSPYWISLLPVTSQ